MRSDRLTSAQSLFRRHRIFDNLGDQRDILAGGQTWDQIVELEDKADMMAPILGQSGFTCNGEVAIAIKNLAAGRHVQSAQYIEKRGFTAAGRTEQHDEFRLGQFEVHAAERMHLHLAHVVDLCNPGMLEKPNHCRAFIVMPYKYFSL